MLVVSFPIGGDCILGMRGRWQGTLYSLLTILVVTERIRENQEQPVRRFFVWRVVFCRRFLLSLAHNLMLGNLRQSLVRIVFPQQVV